MKKTAIILLTAVAIATLSTVFTSDAQAWYRGGVYGPRVGFSYGFYGYPSVAYSTTTPMYYVDGGWPCNWNSVPVYRSYRVYKPYRAYRAYRRW
jgi:hypothetical protein